MLVVAVTGGRNYADRLAVEATLDAINVQLGIALLVCGGCTGADQLALDWANKRCIQTAVFAITPAQWRKHGGIAGPLRNRIMLKTTSPDVLVAFPGGKGTRDCTKQATDLAIEVQKVTDHG